MMPITAPTRQLMMPDQQVVAIAVAVGWKEVDLEVLVGKPALHLVESLHGVVAVIQWHVCKSSC